MKFKMYLKIKNYRFALLFLLLLPQYVFAAKIVLTSPKLAPSNGQPLIAQVFLDPEEDELSGVSGSFSFPEKLFTVGTIYVQDSVVSLWVKEPAVSLEKNIDGRTRVTFEGIFPGGFRGIQSPYYSGYKPGLLFTILLSPKQDGVGSFIVDDISLHRYDKDASQIDVENEIREVTVPTITTIAPKVTDKQIVSTTLKATITSDDLVKKNAWYVFVRDEKAKSSVASIAIAETDSYYPPMANDFIWRTMLANPSLLVYQERNKYVHIKVLYSDHTFAITTLPPVENSKKSTTTSRILIGISIVLALSYAYATHQARTRRVKKEDSHSS